MKKISIAFAMIMVVLLSGCSSDTPEAISKKWCDMTATIKNTPDGAERDKLKAERRAFEKSVEEKHDKDDAFMKKIEELTRACNE